MGYGMSLMWIILCFLRKPLRDSTLFTVLCNNIGMSWEIFTAMSLCWLFHSKVFIRAAPLTNESWNFLVKDKSCNLLKCSMMTCSCQNYSTSRHFWKNKLNLPFQRWLLVMNEGGTIFQEKLMLWKEHFENCCFGIFHGFMISFPKRI